MGYIGKEIKKIIHTGINLNRILRLGMISTLLLIGFFFSYRSTLFFFQGGKLALEWLEWQERIQRVPEEIIQAPKEEAPFSFGEKELPEQLFDISFEIDDSSIKDIEELTARVILVSFGKVPTPVDLTFTILDESGQVVYTKKDYIVVESEIVFTKKFENIELAPGKYTLVLNTFYNVDVEDEFKQDFEIIP